MMFANAQMRGRKRMSDTADPHADELEHLLQEFYDEHEREPYSHHEFVHWYIARVIFPDDRPVPDDRPMYS
jgi:hypothetical protein